MSYSVQNIRNVCLLGHSGSGKTALAESLLYITGAIDRMGRCADGNTVCDYDPEETKRQISLSTAVAPLEYKGCRINVLDTPGAFDFGPVSFVEGDFDRFDVAADSLYGLVCQQIGQKCQQFGFGFAAVIGCSGTLLFGRFVGIAALVLFAQVKLGCIGGQFGLFVGEIDSGRSLFSVGLLGCRFIRLSGDRGGFLRIRGALGSSGLFLGNKDLVGFSSHRARCFVSPLQQDLKNKCTGFFFKITAVSQKVPLRFFAG